MKRILSLIITLTLVFTMFALATPSVAAEVPAGTCTSDAVVYVHYHRWDDTYTDTYIHTWGTGDETVSEVATGRTVGDIALFGEDSFGGIYEICIDADTAGDTLGVINKYTAGWGDGNDDRDAVDTDGNGSKDGNHKEVLIKDDNGDLVGFDVNGVKHVYVFEGSNQVNYADDANSLPYSDGLATIAIIYYDAAQSYDAWNIWTWDTGTLGTKVGTVGEDPNQVIYYDNSGVPFVSGLGYDGGIEENFRVAFINVDPADMAASIGFIVRTNGWEKKFDGDIALSTDGMVAGDFTTLFYIAGEGTFYDNFVDFEAVANLFEIDSARALDRTSVEVVFNKDLITKKDDIDVFDPTYFTLEDKDGNAITIDSVSYNSTTDANDTFTLILDAELSGAASPYTVTYNDTVDYDLSMEFDVDSTPPTITIIGSQNVELELGDTYSLPTYSASDMVGEEAVSIYNVKVKTDHGTVDTRYAGIYEVVIVAEDAFGNVTEKTITVTVKDPCDETAHLDANNFNTELMALLIGLPLAIGAVVTLRREY